MTTLLNMGGNGVYNLDHLANCACGGSHIQADHWQFLEGMPQDPADLVADLIEMGHYAPETLSLAKESTHADYRQALVDQLLSQATPEQRQLCNDLMQQAGGLDAALAAAFGPHASEFLSDTMQSSTFRRRDFLTKVAATAAIISLASCVGQKSPEAIAPNGKLEKTDITIGFIPITCATPILVGEPLGFYKKFGLNVTLKKMTNWASVRESAIAGELDAYHMLSPMPIAISLGLGSTTFPIQLASIENLNGQSIAVAMKHKGKIKGPADFKGLTIGIPFPYSMHNLLMRYYLATGGLNPDKDVNLELVPPPDSVAKMGAGQLDAFLMPDNFSQRAVFEKIGFIHLSTKDLWPGHPCCSFATSKRWIDANPQTFQAVNKAIIASASYANDPNHRAEIAKILSERKYLNQPQPVLDAVLTGNFADGLGNNLNVPDRIKFEPYPWESFAYWISSQLVRWNLLPASKANYKDIAEKVYQTKLAGQLQKELGQNPPTETIRTEKLKFGDFDPNNAEAYVQEQIKKYGV